MKPHDTVARLLVHVIVLPLLLCIMLSTVLILEARSLAQAAREIDAASQATLTTSLLAVIGRTTWVIVGILIAGFASLISYQRTWRLSLERERAQAEIAQLEEYKHLSLSDELTGVLNRRGFLFQAEQQLRTADRLKQNLWLMMIDMDGLKIINDTYGHEEGSRSICIVAEILRGTFRRADLVARIGGDEFVVLGVEGSAHMSMARLDHALVARNDAAERKLSISIGIVERLPGGAGIEGLMVDADKKMYQQKRLKKGGRPLVASTYQKPAI